MKKDDLIVELIVMFVFGALVSLVVAPSWWRCGLVMAASWYVFRMTSSWFLTQVYNVLKAVKKS